ncbi:hypothetical protein G3M48_010107 [Beauveria asiatica]|uniref:Uncharacterized protein n=1 Tax=Beauveria asiatica TaxID=1069075 RepID=A0AAW0RHK7_9HYPO
MGSENAQLRTRSYHRGSSSRASPGSGAGTGSQRKSESEWYNLVVDDDFVCELQVPGMKNWKTFLGKRPRFFVAGLTVRTEGSVEVVTAHARLAKNFESTLGAGAPGQVFRKRVDDCVMKVHSGMQDRDLEPFKDFLAGDDTVDRRVGGSRFTMYRAGDHRGPYRLDACPGKKYIRVKGDAAHVSRNKDGTCAVVFSFKLAPGAKVTIHRMTFVIYY